MVVKGRARGERRDGQAGADAAAVIWHDLECGRYGADLPLWLELAEREPGPVLDLGAGTGRVALELARAGHRVTALDRDAVLLGALRGRAGGLPLETVCADARSFSLRRRDYGLCLVPMQTIQLLGGASGREAMLRSARAHLRASGLLACAILGPVEPFDCAAGELGPAPEEACVGKLRYVSRPTRVGLRARSVVIEREREVLIEGRAARASGPAGATSKDGSEREVLELDRVSAAELEREGRAAGLRAEPRREVAQTDEHAGSVVVMLRA